MKSLAFFAAATSCISGALAHYQWRALIVNGTTTPDFSYVRRNSNLNDFVSYSSNDLRCDVGSFASAKSTKVATVEAGSKVGMVIYVGAAHIGPVTFYLSKAPNGDVTSYDGSGDWFKVYEIGPTVTGGHMTWTTNSQPTYNFELPKSLPDGEYLLRGEHLALHIQNNPQIYPGCAQIKVVNGGNGTPSPLVKIPGVYKSGDPSVFLNPYSGNIQSYAMPGPAVWSG